MSILVLSADMEAARSLCSALTRSGCPARWQSDLQAASELALSEPPLVLVADTDVTGHETLLDSVRRSSPWARLYLLSDRKSAPGTSLGRVLVKPFDASEVAALLASEHELAELDRRRRGLEARADELALLVEASFEAILYLAADGTIRSWNAGAAAAYGYRREDMVGQHIDRLEIEPGAAAKRLVVGERRSVEVRRRRKDGADVLVLLSLAPISGPGGEPIGFAEVSLDITERRKLEQALQHGERLAAIGRIAASMAHEINNPLAVIRASASRIEQIAQELGHEELAECAADCDLATERIASFVQHVCGFARRERPVLSDLPVRGALEMAMRLVRPRAGERGVTMKLEPGPDPRVLHDPPRLGQALLNVMANAVDAAAAGGHTVVLRVVQQPTCVRIEVQDDGPGIAPEIAGRLFEAFATTKPPGQGTGLGLSITRQILEDHGGTVSLEPADTGGARAVLSLPVEDLSNVIALIVDGDPAVRRALAADVARGGFSVRSVGSLADAKSLVAQEAVRIILTDLRLPDGNALEWLAELKEQKPSIGRIVVTADSAGAASSVVSVLVEKPWSHEKLISILRQLCLAH